MTRDGGELSHKISPLQLLWLGVDSFLKILKDLLVNESINEFINDEGVYRTAPATPGLLITWQFINFALQIMMFYDISWQFMINPNNSW